MDSSPAASPKQIGILFPSRRNGGVFQFAVSIAENLAKFAPPGEFAFTAIHFEGDEIKDALTGAGGKISFAAIPEKKIPLVRRIAHFLALFLFGSTRIAENTAADLKDVHLDLIIYPTPFTYDFFRGIPSIAFIPNVMHKYYPNLPEFPFMTRVTRDIVYRFYAKQALFYASDSKQGIEDINRFLGVPLTHARAMPFIPTGFIYAHKDMSDTEAAKILEKFKLPPSYLFYPAQFWPHKNHHRLMRAIGLIKKEHGIEIPLVLSGSAKGRFAAFAETVFEEIKALGLDSQIIRLGYVSDEEMVALYKRSYALLNPSLLGPTGIPFVEAIVLGVPVLAANLWEIPATLGPAGLLFDPLDEKDIASKVLSLWQDKALRLKLIEGAKSMQSGLTPDTYASQWLGLIRDAFKELPTKTA